MSKNQTPEKYPKNQTPEKYPNENLEDGTNSDLDKNSRAGNKPKSKERKGSSESATRENTHVEGYGSSQRSEDTNVGPFDGELNDLPSKGRTPGNNQTGPGLG